MNDDMEELVEKLIYLVPTLEKRVIKSLDIGLKSNVSPLQYRALFILNDEGILSMSELSKKMFVSKQQVTMVIDKLIKLELVERILNKDDRRIINVKISDNGIKAIISFKDEIMKGIKPRLSLLSEEDFNKFLVSLNCIYNITEKLIWN